MGETRGLRRPTLREVAGLAGVSIKTASRVVNGEPGVGPEKVRAVELAVRRLDYRPNVSASSLRRNDGRTAAVAALLEDLANPFSAGLHRALEDAARENSVVLFAGSIDEDPARERSMVREFTTRRADALVIAPASADQEYLEHELADGTPVVFVDRAPSGFAADAVVTDNAEAAERAVLHLLRQGHREVAFLGDRESIVTARQRRAGFEKAMASRELFVAPSHVVGGLHRAQLAERAVADLLDSDRPPTAFFAAQNDITVGTVRELHRRGLEHEIAVVGFDDFPTADLVEPGVTVMAQDPGGIGREAAALLFRRLGGYTGPFETRVVPCRLIERGSGEIARA